MFFNNLVVLLLLFTIWLTSAVIVSRDDCEYRRNLTTDADFVNAERLSEEEDCLYYYLMDVDYAKTRDVKSFYGRPPPEDTINITIEDVTIRHVQLAASTSYQFIINGDIFMYWQDSRLAWDEKKFDLPVLYLRGQHRIWTPPLLDKSICTESASCDVTYKDIDITSDGTVSALVSFRYSSFCGIDFRNYPEEENTCCIFFTSFEPMKRINIIKLNDISRRPTFPLVMQENEQKDRELGHLAADHSAWILTEQSIVVTHLAISDAFQVLKLCIHATKEMRTLKSALRVPVLLATIIMLASPLLGDLRNQVYLKLSTLVIQTMCFLYLCSITPPNGFGGVKPKIYWFYEGIFSLTAMSMLITIGAIAASRQKRTIPPNHRLFLAAKLINRFICCIEPEASMSYQRYLGDNEQQPQTATDSTPDYTNEWRHIYLAVNNLFSGFFLTSFLFSCIFDII